MAELPKCIRVGYRDFTVEAWAKAVAEAKQRLGECDGTDGVIRVKVELQPQLEAEVLLHEVLHACYYSGCLDPAADEEKMVNILGNQFTQVWRDNPDFVAFMSESLNPDPPFPSEEDTIGASVVKLKA